MSVISINFFTENLNFTVAAEVANSTIEVAINDSVVIDCCIEIPVTQYLWYKDGNELSATKNISGGESRVLIVPSLQADDFGLYSCVAGKTDRIHLYHVLVIEEGK